jgi:2'-5' RNA ligase
VAESEPLRRLQGGHERICQRLGLAPEARKYAPHITLARLKEPAIESMHAWLARHSLYESRPFPVARFVLFSSRPSRGGGPYAVEESYPLQGSELRAVV